jgi:hypothetical protein
MFFHLLKIYFAKELQYMLAVVLSCQMQIVIGMCDFPFLHTAFYSVPVQTLCLSGTNINLVLISL